MYCNLSVFKTTDCGNEHTYQFCEAVIKQLKLDFSIHISHLRVGIASCLYDHGKLSLTLYRHHYLCTTLHPAQPLFLHGFEPLCLPMHAKARPKALRNSCVANNKPSSASQLSTPHCHWTSRLIQLLTMNDPAMAYNHLRHFYSNVGWQTGYSR